MRTLTQGQQSVREDLLYCFHYFPTKNLKHLLDNVHRLRPGAYVSTDGGGCLFYLLSEAFAPERRIDRRERLREFFTGGHSQEHYGMPEYAAAKNLVWLVDRQSYSTIPPNRYGEQMSLDPELLRDTLQEEILRRSLVPEACLAS